jgi:hypothetical protein
MYAKVNIFDVLRVLDVARRRDAVISVLEQAAALTAARAPEWWRWSAYLAVATTIQRINEAGGIR